MRRPRALPCIVVVAAALAGCSSPEPIEIPAADADPVEVVQAYVAAINAEDRDALAVLSQDGAVPEVWLGTGIELVEIGEPYEEDGAYSGHDGQDVVGVPVQAVFRNTDGSLEEGAQTGWTYLLVEQEGRWVVFDQGNG